MAETAFNTIAEIQRLRDAGFEQAQAEAITLSIHAGVTGGVATKADLEKTEQSLRSEIDLLRSDLDAKIENTEQRLETKIEKAKFDLTWRLLAGFAIINGMMIALLRFLPQG